jgi:hypothetical protein
MTTQPARTVAITLDTTTSCDSSQASSKRLARQRTLKCLFPGNTIFDLNGPDFTGSHRRYHRSTRTAIESHPVAPSRILDRRKR